MLRVSAEHLHVPLSRLQVSLEHLERRGLACAVRAEQCDALAFVDGEAHTLHGVGVAVALVQVVDDDRCHSMTFQLSI